MALSKLDCGSPHNANRSSWSSSKFLFDSDDYMKAFIKDGAARVAAPWIELSEDLAEGISFYTACIMDACRVSATEPVLEVFGKTLCKCQIGNVLCELAEDGKNLWWPALTLALCASSPAGPLVLAGVSLPVKATYAVVGLIFVGGAIKFREKCKGVPELAQGCYSRAICVCFVTGTMYLGCALGGLETLAGCLGCSSVLASYVAFPDLLMHFCVDLVTYPLMLVNIGFVAGIPAKQMLPTIGINVLGSLCAIISATHVPPTIPLYCCLVSFSSMMMTTGFMANFDERASELSVTSKHRTANATWSTMLWWVPPGITIMALAHNPSELLMFTPAGLSIMDLACKLGIAHITLKSRPALAAAASHFAAEDNK